MYVVICVCLHSPPSPPPLRVPDLTCVRVTEAHQVLSLVSKGNKNREVRHTEYNQVRGGGGSLLIYIFIHM